MSNTKKIIPIFVPHRGCPNDCVFCNQKKITGKTNIEVNKDYVIRIVEDYIKTRPHYSDLAFFGGSFTAIDKNLQIELLETAHYYQRKGIFDNIRISTRPDAIDNEILQIQKKYGVKIIELGIQSLDDEVLIKSNRGHTVNDSINASKLIKEYGFTLGHQVMPGLPGSSIEKDIYTCKKSIEMHPNIVRIYPTLTIKETELEKMYKENKYTPLSLENAVKLSTYIYSLYTVNNINVIRIGLQNTDTINEDNDIIAGPFHPAFRQLVEEKLYLNSMVNKLKTANFGENIKIETSKKLMSYVIGQKKCNFNYIKQQLNIKRIFLQEIEQNDVVNIYNDNEKIAKINKDDIFIDYITAFNLVK
ncbi:radical SAM protein [Sedimentibacter sp. zth1]|uniref:elongator complex protein 3 n=1 Tax=Sedimentibacter sp. zth1 TaxID=2816908 RepID=UPI001A910D9E|nr:radical SAM protein [Sedimentibacter sp. zth1]QSX06594.1 radical SAM protein [Sedimentibacter sp. zth1]